MDTSHKNTGKHGLIFVVSAPSGTGKTSLCRGVSEALGDLCYGVSYTTRPPRPGEVDGKDYFFVDEPTFQARIAKNDLLEWAEVHGYLYGTSREAITSQTEHGMDVIIDVDPQGAMALKKKWSDGVYIYILPPSFDALRERLMARRSDTEDEIARRLQKAREEIWNYRQYYYLIVNEDYKEALKALTAIIVAERIKTKRMNFAWIEETFIKQLNKKEKDDPLVIANGNG